MGQLKGTKSHENLKQAFAGESQANRRYLYFARRADIEGYPDVGGLFRESSDLAARKAATLSATTRMLGTTTKDRRKRIRRCACFIASAGSQFKCLVARRFCSFERSAVRRPLRRRQRSPRG